MSTCISGVIRCMCRGFCTLVLFIALLLSGELGDVRLWCLHSKLFHVFVHVLLALPSVLGV